MRKSGILLLMVLLGVLLVPVRAQDEALTQVVHAHETLSYKVPEPWKVTVSTKTEDIFVQMEDPDASLIGALRVRSLWPDCINNDESTEIYAPACQAGIVDVLPYMMEAHWYVPTGREEGIIDTFETPAGEAALYTDRYGGVYGGGLNLGDSLFLVIFWQARDEDAEAYLDVMRQVLESVEYAPPGVDDLGLTLQTDVAGCVWALDTLPLTDNARPLVMTRGPEHTIYLYMGDTGILVIDENGVPQNFFDSERITRTSVYDILVNDDGSFMLLRGHYDVNDFDANGSYTGGHDINAGFPDYIRAERDAEGNLYFYEAIDSYKETEGVKLSDVLLIQAPDGRVLNEFKTESDTFRMEFAEAFLRRVIFGVSPAGLIYIVPDSYDPEHQSELRVFDREGNVVMPKFGAPDLNPSSIGFAADDTVYLFRYGGIDIYNPAGELLKKVELNDFSGSGLALDDGSLILFNLDTGQVCRMAPPVEIEVDE